MARDLARCLDPVLLAQDCGLTLDAWQAELMRSTAHRVLLLCARQTGKSTVTALIALWVALYQAPAQPSRAIGIAITSECLQTSSSAV